MGWYLSLNFLSTQVKGGHPIVYISGRGGNMVSSWSIWVPGVLVPSTQMEWLKNLLPDPICAEVISYKRIVELCQREGKENSFFSFLLRPSTFPIMVACS